MSVDDGRILKVPSPIKKQAFHGVVRPQRITMHGLVPGAGKTLDFRKPEKGETTPLPWQRVEAARQWLTKQNDTRAHQVAEVLTEHWMRLQALKAAIQQKIPEGELRTVLLHLIEGKVVAIRV